MAKTNKTVGFEFLRRRQERSSDQFDGSGSPLSVEPQAACLLHLKKKGVIKLKSDNVADALLKFACENEITHVIFGQSVRSRWQIFLYDSIINRFLSEVKDASVHVIPIEKE